MCSDYIMHALAFYWKVLHALLPPTYIWGGWATFISSLASIGLITCLVGDTAKTFGCLLGLKAAACHVMRTNRTAVIVKQL